MASTGGSSNAVAVRCQDRRCRDTGPDGRTTEGCGFCEHYARGGGLTIRFSARPHQINREKDRPASLTSCPLWVKSGHQVNSPVMDTLFGTQFPPRFPGANLNNPYLAESLEEYGAPGGIRTPNLLIRSQVLYPVELRAHGREGPRGYSKPPFLASRRRARFRALGTVPGGRRFARMGLLGFRGCETASTPIESL